MRAAEAWVALCRAGVTLEDDGYGLRLRVPPGVEPGPWLALGREFGAHLYPLASGAWRAEVEGWPVGMRNEWDERAALRALDDGLTCDDAEQAAFLEVRERALEPHALTIDALKRELGAVLVRLEARRPDDDMGASITNLCQAPPAVTLVRSHVGPCPACGQRWAHAGTCGRCGGRSSAGVEGDTSDARQPNRVGASSSRGPGLRSCGPIRFVVPRTLVPVAPTGHQGAPSRGR